MNEVKVLLCDLGKANGVAENVRAILETDSRHRFALRHEVLRASDGPVVVRRLAKFGSKFCPTISFLLCGAAQPPAVGELVKALRADRAGRPVLVVAETKEPATVAELIRLGATEVFTPPLRAIDLIPRVWRCIEANGKENKSIHDLKERLGLEGFVGESPALIAQIRPLASIAACGAGILITGETGTGKELIAKAIHNLSPRGQQPLVTVHCAALSPTLLESELFGHEKGAFTGAHERRIGRFEQAQGGTLFLDEIGEIDATVQVKLLRFLGEKTFERVGSNEVLRSDVRLVAASNTNLEHAVRSGRFRQDLLYRVNVMTLTLPPLRERGADIAMLARHFLGKFGAELGKRVEAFSPAALHKLSMYGWPGNVRELENVIQRTVVLSTHPVLQEHDILLPTLGPSKAASSFRALRIAALADFEKTKLTEMLVTSGGNISRAARAAELDRHDLRRLIQKHGIPIPGRQTQESTHDSPD